MKELQKCIMHNQILLMTILERLGLDKEELTLLNNEVSKMVEKAFKNLKEKSGK